MPGLTDVQEKGGIFTSGAWVVGEGSARGDEHIAGSGSQQRELQRTQGFDRNGVPQSLPIFTIPDPLPSSNLLSFQLDTTVNLQSHGALGDSLWILSFPLYPQSRFLCS